VARQESDLKLRRYNGRGWRAIFFLSGFEHSLTADAGSPWARSPWEAVQRAAADALRRREAPEPAPRAIGPQSTSRQDDEALAHSASHPRCRCPGHWVLVRWGEQLVGTSRYRSTGRMREERRGIARGAEFL